MMFGKDVVEEGGSRISDVKKTGGGRSKADTHIWNHSLPSAVSIASIAGTKKLLSFEIPNPKLQIPNKLQTQMSK
jgi:hypothetical protein